MDIDLLNTFLEVNKTRHFGRAAENLYITQSAVSARIKLLEEEIGTALFTRTRGNIRPTSAGERLLKYADSITQSWQRAMQETVLPDSVSLSIAVGCSDDCWLIHTRNWLHESHLTNPSLAFSLESGKSLSLLRRLDKGVLDLVFVMDEPAHEGLETIEVATVNLCLYSTSPDQSVADAMAGDYFLVDWGTRFLAQHAAMPEALSYAKLRISSAAMALDYLHNFGGSAFLAEEMIPQLAGRRTLHKVSDSPLIQRRLFAVYKAGSSKRDVIQTLIKPASHQGSGQATSGLVL